jgi:P-type Mg2+ transporter
MSRDPLPFWSMSARELLAHLQTTPQGLTSDEAKKRLKQFGANLLKSKKKSDSFSLLLGQFKSPIILILLFAAGLSFFFHDRTNASISLFIIFASALLGFWQERGAADGPSEILRTY